MTPRPAWRLRRRALLPAIATSAGLALALGSLTAAPASAAPADTLAVDLSQTTGAFRGGATGTLYGLGDDGVPSQPVLDGARITNASQKPPQGAQHPNGDALQVEKSFFAGGGQDLYVYAQDMYPDWPYNGGARPGDANGDGVWDYLPILKQVVEDVATKSQDPSKYVFIPFNEPDGGNWYPNWATQKDQFLADWTAAYQTIESVYAEHGLGHARVGGPGDSSWHADRSADFLAYAKQHSELPDVFIWHELGTNNLATFRSHHDAYTALLTQLGIDTIPVDITEYGMLRDMSVPGQLVQWISMFEDEKVDAQTAYWNYAGNLSDNSSRNNGANGGWWMFKWYGDLAGSTTAAVTPPQVNVPDTLQGLAAIDTAKKKATVLFGGGTNDVSVNLSGIASSVFGTDVHVQVRADRINGAEGASLQPPVVLSTDAHVTNGTLQITVPNNSRYTAYQAEITPALNDVQPVATDLVNSTEAENSTLSDATVYTQDPSREWAFMASNGADVGSFNKADSSATWTVTAPETGDYRLSVLAGANQSPGKHVLFVDGTYNQLVNYSADLSWTYRGTTDTTIHLTAGTHTLSLRASEDGKTVLPGADITLDRFDLYDVTAGEQATYPALDARLSGGAALSWSDADARGYASVSGEGAATFFATAAQTGYYDVTTHLATGAARAQVNVTVNGREVSLPPATGPGVWDSTVRLYLPQGVNEIVVRSASGNALVGSVSTLRGAEQQAADADTNLVFSSQAENLPRSGATVVQTDPANSNGTPDSSGAVHDVGYLGNGAANTLSIPRPAGFGPGEYQLVVAAANADKSASINYNPQLIDRSLDVSESGGSTTQATFRNNYSWNSYWDKTIPLSLSTATGDLTLGNPSAYAPNINTVTLAKFVGAAPTTTQSPTVTVRKYPQTISFPALPDRTFGDSDFSLDATADSGMTVQYAATGACTVTDSLVHLTGAGTCTVTAEQGGNDDFTAAEPVAHDFTVVRGTATVSAPAVSSPWGTAAALTVQVGSRAGAASGQVRLTEGTAERGTATLSGGKATFNLPTGLAAGIHTITATYAGDDDLAQASAIVTVTVVLPSAWNKATAYPSGATVSYNGQVYTAAWYTKDEQPGTTATGAWQQLALTEDGTTVWTSSRIFRAGDQAMYQGKIFQAAWYTRNDQPGSVTGPWQEMAAAADGTAIWTPTRIFNAGDVVQYNGRNYTARWYSRNQTPGAAGGAWQATK